MLVGLKGAVANASIRLDPRDAELVPEGGDVIVKARLRAPWARHRRVKGSSDGHTSRYRVIGAE
jgi:hypothetical protein